MKKKIDFKILVIIILTILVLLYLIYFNIKKNTKVEIEAFVKEKGINYIIVTDKNNDDYLLNTNSTYNIGDKINVVLKNVKKRNPNTGEIVKIDTVSKNVAFSITDEPQKDDTIKQNNETNNKLTNTVINDEEIITYFNNFSNEIDNSNNLKSSIKEKFVTIVDFLFYEGEIKEKTFSELSDSTKLKVLEIFLNIDKKLDDKFPGYKENISATGNEIYTNIKIKALEAYLNITTEVCQNNEDLCTSAKMGLSEIKESLSLTIDFIKEISGVGMEKLKSWYEIWKSA